MTTKRDVCISLILQHSVAYKFIRDLESIFGPNASVDTSLFDNVSDIFRHIGLPTNDYKCSNCGECGSPRTGFGEFCFCADFALDMLFDVSCKKDAEELYDKLQKVVCEMIAEAPKAYKRMTS